MKILVTGGSGFIGSNFLHKMMPQFPDDLFINLDKLTYASHPDNLSELSERKNYRFIQADLADQDRVEAIFDECEPDRVFHFAAESHVDRSVYDPRAFINSNIIGTFNLLEACRRSWREKESHLFHHVSTDEVYGSLGDEGAFTERSPYDPSSPYSASKAASDHLVRAYHRTYGLPVKITNCSNNYGPRQFPEKLIPLMILNALEGKPLPVYGEGKNVRDWLFVEDHCDAILLVAQRGAVGETYNIGGGCERSNLQVVRAICQAVAEETNRSPEALTSLIAFVPDRPGHDWRYAIDATKLMTTLGWKPSVSFESGVRRTVRWYLSHPNWIERARSEDYRAWVDRNYHTRI